jgi:hypothetical protein
MDNLQPEDDPHAGAGGQMRDWFDEFFGWVRVVFAIVCGPIIVIGGLVSGMWGYVVVGILFSIFGAFVLKWVVWGK